MPEPIKLARGIKVSRMQLCLLDLPRPEGSHLQPELMAPQASCPGRLCTPEAGAPKRAHFGEVSLGAEGLTPAGHCFLALRMKLIQPRCFKRTCSAETFPSLTLSLLGCDGKSRELSNDLLTLKGAAKSPHSFPPVLEREPLRDVFSCPLPPWAPSPGLWHSSQASGKALGQSAVYTESDGHSAWPLDLDLSGSSNGVLSHPEL